MNQIIRLRIFRVIAGYMALYHLVFGFLVVFLGEQGIVTTARILYRIDVDVTPQILYLAKFIGAYGIAFGAMMALVAWQPVRYRNFVWAAVALVGVRVFERFFFFDLLNEAFNVNMANNLVTIGIITFFAVALVIFMPRQRQIDSTASA